MITIGDNGNSGQIHTKRYPPTGIPENTDRTYVVQRCGPFHEVRCVTRERGKITGDQLVDCGLSEQEAEAMARELANPVFARNRGKRILEELLEDGE